MQVPVADFFEVNQSWTAEAILELLSNQYFDSHFRATEKISAGWQMTSEVREINITKKILQRSYWFSFNGYIHDSEKQKLQQVVKDSGNYSSVSVTNYGKGLGAFTVVGLIKNIDQ